MIQSDASVNKIQEMFNIQTGKMKKSSTTLYTVWGSTINHERQQGDKGFEKIGKYKEEGQCSENLLVLSNPKKLNSSVAP